MTYAECDHASATEITSNELVCRGGGGERAGVWVGVWVDSSSSKYVVDGAAPSLLEAPLGLQLVAIS